MMNCTSGGNVMGYFGDVIEFYKQQCIWVNYNDLTVLPHYNHS